MLKSKHFLMQTFLKALIILLVSREMKKAKRANYAPKKVCLASFCNILHIIESACINPYMCEKDTLFLKTEMDAIVNLL